MSIWEYPEEKILLIVIKFTKYQCSIDTSLSFFNSINLKDVKVVKKLIEAVQLSKNS